MTLKNVPLDKWMVVDVAYNWPCPRHRVLGTRGES
jgi:hypothetical protein